MPIKVSIVVPVYNPGAYIEPCIESILGQSLPADEYEAIFVDDGSTDATPARLDRLAADHPNVRVIHTPNSGWPGRPRNLGIDASAGEFVQFVDHDDRLGPEAMQRMYAYGVANHADVIVGKMAGQGRGVPRELFRKNQPVATVDSAPLIDSLSPHAMFRRSFLNEAGLRYPEGRRRLEDHVFVAEAYLRARNVSVLSDYVCYYHVKRDDKANAAFQRFDPVGYFANLSEALDVVDRFTEPGPLRDKLYRRWFRNEMIERLRGRRMLRWPRDHRIRMFHEIHTVAAERFGPGVSAGLQPIQQIVAALITADRLDDLTALARWEVKLAASATLHDIRWVDGALHIAYGAEFRVRGAPMTYRRDNGVVHLDPPLSPAGWAAVAAYGADTAVRVPGAKADLVVRHRDSAAEFFQPIRTDRTFTDAAERPRFVLNTVATLDPLTAAAGKPLPHGVWDLFVRVSANGWTEAATLGAHRDTTVPASLTAAVLGDPARLVLPYWIDRHDNLALDVGQQTNRFAATLAEVAPERITVTDQKLHIALPVHVPAPAVTIVRYVEASPGPRTEKDGVLDTHGVLRADLPAPAVSSSRARVDVAFPASDGGGPHYLPLGVALQMRPRSRPRVVRRGSGWAAPSRRRTPRRIVAALRRRAGHFKRRTIG